MGSPSLRVRRNLKLRRQLSNKGFLTPPPSTSMCVCVYSDESNKELTRLARPSVEAVLLGTNQTTATTCCTLV